MKLPRKWQMVMEENSEYKFSKVLDENEKKSVLFLFKKIKGTFWPTQCMFYLSLFFFPSFERQPCKAIIINIC